MQNVYSPIPHKPFTWQVRSELGFTSPDIHTIQEYNMIELMRYLKYRGFINMPLQAQMEIIQNSPILTQLSLTGKHISTPAQIYRMMLIDSRVNRF